MSRHTRRQAIAGIGVGSLAACSRTDPNRPKPRVSIHRAQSYSQDLFPLMRRILDSHSVDVRGKRVVLKPNLVEFDEQTSINTNPLFVHAVAEAFRAAGASKVTIAEGPGHRRITMDLAEAAGYEKLIPGFTSDFVDLNLDEVAEVKLASPLSRLRTIHLPKTILDCDLLVSLPKMKTHHWVGATLSMKNLFGVVPGAVYGWPKNVLHWAGITQSIVDLHRALPRRFAIVDGIIGMEGNGPIQGTPKAAGVIVAGADSVAVDATCCRIMGLDPERIGYLAIAQDIGQTRESIVEQIGETIAATRTRFQVLPLFETTRLPG